MQLGTVRSNEVWLLNKILEFSYKLVMVRIVRGTISCRRVRRGTRENAKGDNFEGEISTWAKSTRGRVYPGDSHGALPRTRLGLEVVENHDKCWVNSESVLRVVVLIVGGLRVGFSECSNKKLNRTESS